MINILLCSHNSEQLVAFYRIVGAALVKEQHGSSPEHFAFSAPVTMEIYPPRQPATADYVLRFEIANVDATLHELKEHFSYAALILQEPENLVRGRKAIIRDPDGRIVELFQSIKPPEPQ
jgi:hypothetical protein